MIKKVKTAPTAGTVILNDAGKAILDEAIRDLGLGARAKVLWIMHPLLIDVAIRFAEYVGPHAVTEDGSSLLKSTLTEAFSKHKAELEQSENDHVAQALFARTLLTRSAEVFSQEIVVTHEGGDEIWNPFVCGATTFIANFENPQVSAKRSASKLTTRLAQTVMLVKLVPEQMLDTETVTELFNDATITV